MKHLPVLTGADRSARTNDDLKGFAATAWWKPLVPQEVAVPEPQNIVTTLHAPTVSRQDASLLPQKHNFVEVFDHEPFVAKEKIPQFHRNGQPMLNNGQTVWTEQFTNEGGPNAEFLFENGLNVNSTPQDWLMAFLPLYDGTARCSDRESNVCFSHKWAKFTNMKAVQMGAGVQGGCYPSFLPFTYNEIERFIGLYILQGLNPSPRVGAKFSSQRADPVQGSDLCHQVFGDNTIKWHKQFKAFFSLQDPTKPAPTRKECPTYKVDSFLKHLQQVSMKAWRLGQNISGDEQTIGFQGSHADKLRITYKAEGDGFQCDAPADSGFIGFQGRHADKLRITYKAEGDGFQCDALADSGFTWTFYFCNQPAPPLHSCILGMFDQLENKFHNCWFNNLYLSARLAKAAWTHSNKVRISGPTRKSGRGLSKMCHPRRSEKCTSHPCCMGNCECSSFGG